MKTSTLFAALAAGSLLLFQGCDRSDPKTNAAGLVAVVDMARLQGETGFTKNRVAELKKLQDQLEPSFAALQATLNGELEKELQALRKFPTSQQQAKVEQMRATYSQVLDGKYTEIQNQMQQRDTELLTMFRQKVHESISTAAAERGMSVIIETGPWMVAASDECNVTSSALAKIKAANINFDTMSGGVTGSPGISGIPGAAPRNPSIPGNAPGMAPGMAPGAPNYGGGPAYQPSGPSYPGAPIEKRPAPAPVPAPVAPGASTTPAPSAAGAPAPVPAPTPATQPQ